MYLNLKLKFKSFPTHTGRYSGAFHKIPVKFYSNEVQVYQNETHKERNQQYARIQIYPYTQAAHRGI